MNCIICQSEHTENIQDYQSPFVNARFKLYKCENCSSLFFDINQPSINLTEIYEEYAQNNISYKAEFIPSGYWKNEVSQIRHICLRPIQSILDVGCRTGDFLLHWPDHVNREGIELSRFSANIAAQRGLHITQVPVEQAVFSQKFDVITCYAILEHLQDPLSLLANLSENIEINGVLVIMIPTWQSLKPWILAKTGKQWHMYSPPQHVNFFSRRKLDLELNKKGFKLVKRIYTSGGMVNPFPSIPILRALISRLFWIIDSYTPFRMVPIFDHMYSYYIKEC